MQSQVSLLEKGRAGGRFEKQGEGNVATEAETVMRPQAKEYGGSRSWKRQVWTLPEGLRREQGLGDMLFSAQ